MQMVKWEVVITNPEGGILVVVAIERPPSSAILLEGGASRSDVSEEV